MRIISFFVFASLLCSPTIAAKKPVHKKAAAQKPVAQKAAPQEAPKNTEEYLKDVITFPGATKIPVIAKQAILIDYNTKRVLLEKHADERMIPSSMTKMMTSYIIEDRIEKGALTLDSSFPVSERAWRTQGSKMFVPLGQTVKVGDLLRGIVIQSGNDACVVAAEGISGGEVQFAAEMNATAARMGLKNTKFKNASGLPEDDHYSTARDLAILGSAVVADHPNLYKIYQEKDFTFNGIKQGNRNPLLYDNFGCDGIKTGHTDDGGYGVAASCVDGGQRYILVIGGLSSMQERADEARKLINWARENFVKKVIVKKGDILNKSAPLKMGVKTTIPAIAEKDVSLLVLRTEQDKVQTKIILQESIEAPIKKGAKVGKIVVTSPGGVQEGAVVSGESVERIGIFKRAMRYIGMSV